MKKILGIIITYNPDIILLNKNISSFIDIADEILIIDNNSINKIELLSFENNKIKVVNNERNLGIAEGLNIGLNYAHQNRFDYILTMDQDSYFEKNTVSYLITGFNEESIAIVCPSLKDMNSNNFNSVAQIYEEIFVAITSGCLCSVRHLKSIGGFNIKLFIDYVDFELCLRLQKSGYKILQSQKSVLCHQLGDSRIEYIFNIPFICTNHSPFRRFYYARNKVYIYKNYFFSFPIFILRDIGSFFKTIFIILFFEKFRAEKFKMICKGIWHGLFYI
ncbi:glycosyltransferase [Flavobacterium cellulosilyticum]|uniref:Glycosyltransferase n=1 Tax=Flavobacterium cellulosilyticum TaxID=2541731 RepID=A0A4R5CH39_9FLAO|nr:glycosyltransferase [Flavobacterium cellulosilyticum]TDD98379.1 glycosyltransferase [Flavobacterium cellulosilyticum]